MALTNSQQNSWDENKLYWFNRWVEQDLKNDKDYKVIEKKLKEELKKVKDEIIKELAYQTLKKNDLSDSEIYQFYNTWVAIDNSLEGMANTENQELEKLLEDKYKEVYEKNMKILGVSFNTINTELIKEVVKTNWSGLEFSERIWKNKDLLSLKIKEEFQKGLIRGDSLQDISNRLVDSLNNSFKNTMRLVRTETCAIQSKATINSYIDSGVVKKFEFCAFLDSKTSPQCREMDGKIIELNNGQVGDNLPPLHPNCRSCILPVIEGKTAEKEEAAINKNNSKTSLNSDPNVYNKELTNNRLDNSEKDNKRRRFISYSNVDELSKSEVNKKATKFIHKLKEKDEEIYKSLRTYTGSSYSDINNQLRKNQNNRKEDIIEKISKGLKQFKAPEEFMVHRGTTKRAIKDIFKDEAEFREVFEKCTNGEATQEYLNEKFVGNIIVDKGFMSTSCLSKSAFTKDLTLHINIEKGTNYGAYINELSNFKDKEYEFLLDKNLAMEIYDIELSESGKLNLYLNIVGYAD